MNARAKKSLDFFALLCVFLEVGAANFMNEEELVRMLRLNVSCLNFRP